jgi:hypothetical protein
MKHFMTHGHVTYYGINILLPQSYIQDPAEIPDDLVTQL